LARPEGVVAPRAQQRLEATTDNSWEDVRDCYPAGFAHRDAAEARRADKAVKTLWIEQRRATGNSCDDSAFALQMTVSAIRAKLDTAAMLKNETLAVSQSD
jgi:hypothetical protein